MKKIIVLPLFLIFSFTQQQSAQKLTSQQDDNFTGVWQDLNVVGSGWSDTFMFYSNGDFKFFSSQMDCSKREISRRGTYVLEDDRLILNITGKTVIEGGYMGLSTGSCGSDSTLIDGVVKKLVLDHPVKVEYRVSKVTSENVYDSERYILFINGVKHWRFAADPDDLINQFEFD